MERPHLTSTQNRGSPFLTGGRGADIRSAVRGAHYRSPRSYRRSDPHIPYRGSWVPKTVSSDPNDPFDGSLGREHQTWGGILACLVCSRRPVTGRRPSLGRRPVTGRRPSLGRRPVTGRRPVIGRRPTRGRRPNGEGSRRPQATKRSLLESLEGTPTQGSAQQRPYLWDPG